MKIMMDSKIRNSFELAKKSRGKSFEKILINYSFSLGAINEWEKEFYLSIKKKKIIGVKQSIIRFKINNKIIDYFEK